MKKFSKMFALLVAVATAAVCCIPVYATEPADDGGVMPAVLEYDDGFWRIVHAINGDGGNINESSCETHIYTGGTLVTNLKSVCSDAYSQANSSGTIVTVDFIVYYTDLEGITQQTSTYHHMQTGTVYVSNINAAKYTVIQGNYTRYGPSNLFYDYSGQLSIR